MTISSMAVTVGVNCGGILGMSLPEFGVRDANANCPQDFVTFQFQTLKLQIACITMQ